MAADPTLVSFVTAAFGIRLFIAVVFLAAAQHKLSHRLEFQGIVGQYKLTPSGINEALSWIVPLVELACAGLLLVAPFAGALVAMAVLCSYAAAIALNLYRGRQHIDCGCGGEATPLSPGLVARNLLMALGLSIVLFVEASSITTSLSFYAIGLGLGFALGLGTLYVSYNQLQVNAGIYRRLWLGERVG